MITLLYLLVLIIIGFAAGLVGSLSGLGGGIVVVPALTILLGLPIQYAAGASLVATIATSSGSATNFVKEKIANIRIGMSLEIATTLGAIVGSLIAAFIYSKGLPEIIFIIFGFVLIFSIIPAFSRFREKASKRYKDDWSTKLFGLRGSYYDLASKKEVKYNGVRWWFGEAVMSVAGIVSGLLGIGSGTLKAIGMDWGMKLPIKVTTSTSNFMIGVTAAASTGVYWALGYIQPVIIAPVVIGVLGGSFYGSHVLDRIKTNRIRLFFMLVLAIAGIEMIFHGVLVH